MPVPGPRSQFGPAPGYRNPQGETPTLFNRWLRPGPVAMAGRTAGLQWISLRGNVLGAGQIRRMWRQAIGYVPPPPPYSWTQNGPQPNHPAGQMPVHVLGVTRALRYMTRSVYMGAGIDNTRFAGLHTYVRVREQRSSHAKGRRVTLAAGSVRSRPTVRNRLTSFGSRVPTINDPSPDAQEG